MPPRMADRAQLAAFFDATFRYADEGTFVSLRAFFDDREGVFGISGYPIPAEPAELLATIEAFANRCASAPAHVVFCPPLATFRDGTVADERSLVNGLALSVECDKLPAEARIKLESLLGYATVAVASGGEWIDPETGDVQDKLHLHWRLSEPTRTEAEHKRLKLARTLAAGLVGGDASNKPVVHPIRWPGSWHRKAMPRLTSILALTDHELDLDDALERLQEAAEAAGTNRPAADAADPGFASEGEARETAELIAAVLTADDYHGPLVALAMRFLRGGMADAQAVLTLRGVMLAVPAAARDMKDGTCQTGRWQARYDDIPRMVSTARAKCGEPSDDAAHAAPRDTKAHAWPAPLDFIADQASEPPTLTAEHIPAALFPFVIDTAERMGVDSASVALGCIVTCASVANDDWKVQPKRHDYTWTENPRLWGAIVGDPSILKTPVISACTKPIDKLEAAASERHREAMRQYKQRKAEAKADKSGATPEPVHPRRDRYLIEGATVEAISEVLRDDDEALQRAPAGKVLSRHDEMSEFFGNLDRYKSGGKGGGDRGAYLRLFNGGPYTIDRVMRGAFSIPNWSACYLGGIQPGPIQKIAKDAAEDGLLQRFIYAVPGPQKAGLDRPPAAAAVSRYHALIPVLAARNPPRTPDGEHVQTVVLHADAHQHREDVDIMARAMAGMPDTSTRLKAAFGKWPGLFARLALTFHLIEAADARARGEVGTYAMVLTERTAEMTAGFMLDIVLPHMLRADALMFSTAQTGHAKWIAGHILAHGLTKITTRDIVRAYGALRAPECKQELAEVMASMVAVGWLEPEVPSNPVRPVGAWFVNPAVHEVFAGKAAEEQQRRQATRADMAARAEQAKRRRAPDA